MSWSFNVVGKSADFPEFFDKESARLTGDSKTEFDEARPHLQALIGMNVNTNCQPLLSVNASGHASKKDGIVTYSNCSVEIKSLPGQLIGG